MKKIMKLLVTNIVVIALLLSVLTFNVSAASITVSGGEFNVGQNVDITVNISNDTPIMTAQVTINYNASVLTLKSVSGAEYTSGNGTIKIVDDNFSTATQDVTTGSYKLSFTAAAAGNSNITANVDVADKNLGKSSNSASAAVSVVTPKPSSNANLASIKLSNGTLTPAFNAKTTNYNVTVKYDVDSITITGSVADGGATYAGGGTFGLQVGDNSRVLTVTAADGTKKSYTVNIRRMSEEETLEAEQAARDANPFLVVIEDVDYTISNDITNIVIPAGFTQGTSTRKETEVTVLNDDSGKYQLYWLVGPDGTGAFYTRDEQDNFTRLVYVNSNGKMYIVEDLDLEDTLPENYKKTKYSVDGVEVNAIAYTDERLKDFYILNCYVDGVTAHYRLDTVEGTMQRAVDFDAAVETLKEAENQPQEIEKGFFASFKNMNGVGKAVVIIIAVAAVVFIAVAVILIIKIVSSRRDYDFYEEETTENEFILNDFADEVSQTVEDEQTKEEISELIDEIKQTENTDSQEETASQQSQDVEETVTEEDVVKD